MVGRYNQNYGSNESDNNSSSDNDDEERATLTLSAHTAVNATIADFGSYEADWGTSAIVKLDDVDIIDGIVMKKTDKEETYKVFSWDEFGFVRDEEGVIQVEEDQIPNRNKISVGGTDHVYETVGYAAEGRDDLSNEYWLDDVIMWMSVSSKARTLAELLSIMGEDAVPDDDRWTDDYEWLRDGAGELRSDLQDEDVELFFKEVSYMTEVDGEEVERSYDKAVLVEAESGDAIFALDGAGGGGGDSDGVSEPDPTVSEGTGDEIHSDAEPILDLFLDKADEDGVPPRENVEAMLAGSLPEDEDTEAQVDAVIENVEAAV